MAEIRSVSVHLDADVAGYIAKMRLAGAETDRAFSSSSRSITSTDAKLQHAEGTLRKVDSSAKKAGTGVRSFGSSVDQTRIKVDNGAKSIDRYSGRLGILLDAVLALGPALVPIGGVAIGAGLGASLDITALLGGFAAAKLATIGLGSALKALNTAALEPTAENILKAREELDKLPPSERKFVVELSRMKPVVDQLRASAAQGLFPGLEKGLHDIQSLLPQANRLLFNFGLELGHLGEDAGKSLGGPEWHDFFNFIGREGPAALDAMARSAGHVAHGLAEILMAGAPLEHGFNDALIEGATAFDKWATGLSKTQGFQDFLAYIQQTGPEVGALLDQLGQLLVNITKAAAPIGGPVLEALTGVLKVLNAIGGTNAGPAIYATLIALRLLSRTQQAFGRVAETSWGQAAKGAEGYAAKVAASRGVLIKGGLAAAGLGLAVSGAADKSWLLNTASLALMGSIAGPWGAAMGAGIGILQHFSSAQSDSVVNTGELTETLNQQTGAITKNTEAYVAQQLQQKGVLDIAEQLGVSTELVTQAALGNVKAQASLQQQYDATKESIKGNAAAGADLSDTWGTLLGVTEATGKTVRGTQGDVAQLNRALHGAAGGVATYTRAERKMMAQQAAAREAAAKTAQSFLTLGDDIDNAKVSLNQWIRQLASQAQALTNFGNNARKAADKGLRDGLIKQLAELGPQGALRMRQLANASQSEIARANAAWNDGRRATMNFADAMAYVSNHPATVSINGIPQSISELRAVKANLALIRSKTVTVTVNRTTGGRVLGGSADGGTVPGARTPYGDKVLMPVAPGEEIISNRRGQADRNRVLLKQINNGMADGGTVGGDGSGNGSGRSELRRLRHALEDLTKTLDKDRQRRDAILQQEQQLASSVRDSFRSDFLNPEAGVWGGSAGILGMLRTDIASAEQFTHLDRRLKRRGVSAAVLGQVDTLSEAQALSGLSNKEIAQLNRLYAIRQRASAAAGRLAGQEAYGARLSEANRHLKALRGDVHDLTAQVKHLENAQKDHPQKAGKETAKAINQPVARAVRRAHR